MNRIKDLCNEPVVTVKLPTQEKWKNWEQMCRLTGVGELIEKEGYSRDEIVGWIRDGIPFVLDKEPISGHPADMDMLKINRHNDAQLSLLKKITHIPRQQPAVWSIYLERPHG